MALEVKEREIGDLLVKTTLFPCRRGQRLRNWLMRIIGPGVGGLKAIVTEGDVSQLMPAVGSLLASIDPDELDAFRDEMMKRTSVVVGEKQIDLTKPERMDEAFGSDVLSLDKAFLFALEANYLDFFYVAFGFLAGALSRPGATKKESPSTSPTKPPSSGQDGDSG